MKKRMKDEGGRMRLVHAKRRLPKCWAGLPGARGIVFEGDIRIRASRLRAKLLVFDRATSLRAFWKGPMGKGELGRGCLGAVNQLRMDVMVFNPGRPERCYIEADARYFCVIGLIQTHLSMEIICHEAIHAGFAYAKRVRRSPWDAQARHFDEEAVCYPAGRIAGAINRALYKAGVFPG